MSQDQRCRQVRLARISRQSNITPGAANSAFAEVQLPCLWRRLVPHKDDACPAALRVNLCCSCNTTLCSPTHPCGRSCGSQAPTPVPVATTTQRHAQSSPPAASNQPRAVSQRCCWRLALGCCGLAAAMVLCTAGACARMARALLRAGCTAGRRMAARRSRRWRCAPRGDSSQVCVCSQTCTMRMCCVRVVCGALHCQLAYNCQGCCAWHQRCKLVCKPPITRPEPQLPTSCCFHCNKNICTGSAHTHAHQLHACACMLPLYQLASALHRMLPAGTATGALRMWSYGSPAFAEQAAPRLLRQLCKLDARSGVQLPPHSKVIALAVSAGGRVLWSAGKSTISLWSTHSESPAAVYMNAVGAQLPASSKASQANWFLHQQSVCAVQQGLAATAQSLAMPASHAGTVDATEGCVTLIGYICCVSARRRVFRYHQQ